MDRLKRFEVPLTNEDRYAVEMTIRGGGLVAFVVRYDAFINGKWRDIATFDNHGGTVHWHLSDPITGKGEKKTIPLDLRAAPTYAIGMIQEHWQVWRSRYERRLPSDEHPTLF